MLVANDMWMPVGEYSRMAKNTKNPRALRPAVLLGKSNLDPAETLYLGEWLDALGVRAAKVANETGINEGYLSQLIRRQKANPSKEKLRAIGQFLDIDWRLLYDPPPSAGLRSEMSKYSPALIERLTRPKR